jgi:small subunit ribosomal protein S1
VVLAVDPERERISLGVKQLEQDPFSNYVAANPKGTIVRGVISSVNAKAAIVTLAESVEGVLKASDLSRDRVEDARSILKPGDEIEAKFTGVDRKNRTITLSVKAKVAAEEAEAMQEYSGRTSVSTSLGDALRAQMDANKED